MMAREWRGNEVLSGKTYARAFWRPTERAQTVSTPASHRLPTALSTRVRLLLLYHKEHAVILETARTIVRGWREADIPAYAQMVADPDVMRFIGDGSVHTAAQAT